MKINYILLFILFSNIVVSQDFTQFEFFGTHQPKWTYTSYDSNFVKHPLDPISTAYSGRYTVDINRIEDEIIILEQTVSPANFLGQDGCLVHSIDKNSGKANWVYSDNYYSGKRNREYFLGSHLNVNQESNEVSFSSIRSNAIMSETLPGLFFSGRPSHRIISLEDGREISNLYNDNLTDTLFVNLQNLNVQNADAVFFAQTDRLYRDSSIKLIVRFYEYEQGCENPFTRIDSFVFDTGINEDFPPLASTPSIDNRDGEKLRYLFFINNPYVDSITIEKMYLKELIYQNGKVEELASIDMSDLISFPNLRDEQPDVRSFEGQTFITQLKRHPNWDEYYMFAWYDNEYNRLAHVKNLEYNGVSYYDVYPVSVDDNKFRFFSQTYKGDLIELTLFSLDNNSETLDSLTSIIIDAKGDNFWGIFDFKVLGTDEVLLKSMFSYKNNAGRTSNYMQYSLFEMAGFGITNTMGESVLMTELKIFPNPAQNQIKIEGEGLGNKSILQIYDQVGHLIKEIDYEKTIDVSELKSGIYFLRIIDKSGANKIGKFIKL